jgi:Methionine biosynthesis protein MetW
MSSLVYAHPSVYQLLMRLIYGGGFTARYRAISDLVADGADVFEACAGDAYLYERYLKPRGIRYRAGEFNQAFIAHARARGIAMDRFDLRQDPVPTADIVILHASLYQFMPDHAQVVARLLAATRHTLIISEPVRNLSSSRWALVRWVAKRSADPGSGHTAQRFDEESLDAFFATHYPNRVMHRALIPGGREKLYCLRGQALS